MITNSYATRRSRKKANAQGMVEFALIVPVLLLVLFAIIDLGWITFNFSQLYNGVREGVRFGSVVGFGTPSQYLNCDGIRGKVVANAGYSGIRANNTDISILYDDGRSIDQVATAQVGNCNAPSYAPTAGYTDQNGKVYASGRNVQNGDRIVIKVNVYLRFLTPFMRTFAPNGFNVTFSTMRSVFPDGLLASAETM